MSNNDLKWHFPSTDGGDEQGINDSLRETFEGDHERYVARESIQNSMDARVDYNKPVVVRFERADVATSDIPGIEQLKSILHKATEYAGGEERVSSYAAALAALERETVSVLKISDFNTLGLSGGDQKQNGGGWYKLVRATGVNAMSGVGGGSFGIGKGAPFAASLLRTVFYSTINNEGEHIFQGKARLSSFMDDEGDIRQGTGQYGMLIEGTKGVSSVRDADKIPAFFKREEQGTDVYIIGYQTMEQDWTKLLINSILNNFWAAIHFDDLDVELVDGDKKQFISQENLNELMSEYSAGKDGSYHYYQAVVEPTREFSEKLAILGDVKLFVRMQPGLPKKVQMMRKSKMVVTESSYRVMPDPYVAVFICEDDEGNKKLRDLEPPAHDEWDPKRNKEYGKQVAKELNDWVRGSLRELAGESSTEPEDIPGVSDYLPEIDERDDMKPYLGGDGEPMNTGTNEETAREMGASQEETPYNETNVRQREVSITTSVGRGEGESKPGQVDRKNKTHDDSVDPTKEGNLPMLSTASLTFRAREVLRDGNRMYQAVLNPSETQKGSIRLMAVGDDNEYPIEIHNASDETGKSYDIDGSVIKGIELKQNERLKLLINLKQHKRYVLGVQTNEG